jgi:CelD/BcsL family acetyltransferase involved in cellulose biosynthesis
MMPEGELIEDLGRAEALYRGWDALAVANSLPAMAPAWILAWWKHFASAGCLPRIVAVWEGEELVGLAPFYVEPDAHARLDYRLPGIELTVRLAPLARAGHEWAVATTIGAVLSRADPQPDLVALEGFPLASSWRAALRDSWPGGVRWASRWYLVYRCPTVTLEGHTYESWLAARSAHFRERMRKVRRRFEQAGGTWRFSTAESLSQDVRTLVRLHTERHGARSSLTLDGRRSIAMLENAGPRLLDDARFRLLVLEMDGEAVDATLAIAAGGRLLGVNGGWDERWARFSPKLLHLLYLIDDAIGRGDRQFDMGAGEQPYKLRFADATDSVGWAVLLTPGARLPLTALRVSPMLARHKAKQAAKRTFSEEQIGRLRVVRSRWGRAGPTRGGL